MSDKKTIRVRLIIAVIVVIFCLGTAALAKYISKERIGALSESFQFYFSGDYLSEDWEEYDIFDWDAGISIDIYNSMNGNKSTGDIGYTVTVVGGEINGNKTYHGIIHSNEASQTLNILPNGGVDSEVTVSVTTDSPYVKTIAGVFHLKDSQGKSTYMFTDNGYYCRLIIKTGDNPINLLTINYNKNTLEPDSTDSRMQNFVDGSGSISNLEANATYTFLFFDVGNSSHTTSNSIIDSNTLLLQ